MSKGAPIKDAEISLIINLAKAGHDIEYIMATVKRSRKAVREILVSNDFYKIPCKHIGAKMVSQHVLKTGRSERKYFCGDCSKYFITKEKIGGFYQPTRDELFNMMRFK